MNSFHPIIRKWFDQRFGHPTTVQQQAWPLVEKGGHLLITAPTGSGKTLAAFLWAVNQLLSSKWETGQTRVLYTSPLKALNNDIQRNLLAPLKELERCFSESGQSPKKIQVAVRSGDTPANERQQMLRQPPEILITTPETLNNLLTSKNGRSLLTGLTTVILDEIHAVAGNKRGTHLITAVDRLVELCGEFQRIALSATVKPEERIAAFVGGLRMSGAGNEAHYEPRSVTVVNAASEKQYDIQVDFPADAAERMVDNSWWPPLVERFKETIKQADATLFFANSRRLTEKITRLLNENEEELLAYAHHGSLAKELRLAVERKLKQGELKAIVATSSLELGIDVGALDMVGLVQTPMSVSAAVQRVGRAGHKVGEVSRGVIYPTFGLDFVCAAAMAKAVLAKDVEEILPIEAPLDVLTQTLLSMTCHDERHIDDLYASIRTSYPYRNLSRRQFDLVIAMLTGHYADVRLTELSPRLSFDRLSGRVKARKGTDFLLYMAGGTIADRGYFDLRLQDSGAKIGELDEEFVWERSIGDVFALGSQVWRVREITHNDVMVAPTGAKWDIIPFWKAEIQNRDVHFCEQTAAFLEEADQHISDENFTATLVRQFSMTPPAAKQLIDFLRLQKEQTGTALPHRHNILVEHIDAPTGQTDAEQVILHTLWGGRLNRPFALALSAAWEKKHKVPLQIFADNDGIVLMLPSDFEVSRLFELVTPKNIESLLTRKLEQTGFFGALFRENAGRALLLPKQHFKKRMPLWLNRLRAKKLLKSVQAFDDFPILIETFRTCLQDEFDLPNLKHRLEDIRQGVIRFSETHRRSASLFASGLVFRQTDLYMYSDDTPLANDGAGLKREYIRELIASPHLRPRLPEELLTVFQKKVQRALPGYAPADGVELLDWLKERLMIPLNEWQELLNAMEKPIKSGRLSSDSLKISWRDCGPFAAPLEVLPKFCDAFSIRLEECRLEPLFAGSKKLSKMESDQFRSHCLKRISKFHHLSFEAEETIGPALDNFLGQWLSFYGPIPQQKLQAMWGVTDATMDRVISQLTETSRIMVDIFSQTGQTPEVCDCDNLERLLFLFRQTQRPDFEPLPLTDLPLFVARFQGIGNKSEDIKALQEVLERLFGLPLPAGFWEEAVWPSRLGRYQTAWLDTLLQTSDLSWFGCDEKKLAFAFQQDLELFKEPSGDHNIAPLPSPAGKYNFFDIQHSSQLDSAQTSRTLWENSWRGNISSDTFEVIRKGLKNKFKPEHTTGRSRTSRRKSSRSTGRGAFNRWQAGRPLSGNWYALPPIEDPDPVEASEIMRDRVRQLLRRYGVLFRQLLARELPLLQWSKIFPALRLMEFSGEVISGHFFSGISGLQFASKEALIHLRRPFSEKNIFWLNAQDPASLCGIDLPELKHTLPSRHATTFLVYQGSQLRLVAKRNGRELTFDIEPDHPRLNECLQLFKALLGRDFNPLKKIIISLINGEDIRQSPFTDPLKEFGFEKNFDCLELWRKF